MLEVYFVFEFRFSSTGFPTRSIARNFALHVKLNNMAVINRTNLPKVAMVVCFVVVPLYFMIRKASVDGGYTGWSEWSPCSSECGEGNQTRTRNCTQPPPGSLGKTCLQQNLGPWRELQKCKLKECPIDGGFTEWTPFGDCDKTCGDGVKKRTRSCTNPPPQNEGKNCEGPTEETQACNVKPCPVDGGFSEWGAFGQCDKPCGTGVRKRTRTCTNPPPANGGKSCDGPLEEEEKCNTQPCPVDGGFSAWGEFEACDKTCGGGVQTRKRTCTNPAPANGGKNCDGLLQETRACNTDPCPVITSSPKV